MSSTLPSPLGFSSAVRAVQIGRAGFFGSRERDRPQNRSPQIANDDLLPQFGYVGERYPKTRVLIFGINPARGPDLMRSPGDEIMMPALERFVSDLTEASFFEAQHAYRQAWVSWPIHRHVNELISDLLDTDEIAFSNCLPWRTESGGAFDDQIARKAARCYAHPLISELEPRIVIAMAKRAATILEDYPKMLIWNGSHAAKPSVLQERIKTREHLSRMLRQARR